MLDHEEKFLFKEEILHLSNAVAEPGILDNVEDLLTDVITSPRFDSEVFTLERSLQVMLGPRAGTTLVGLLTVAPEVFDEVAEVRIPSEVHERLVAWRARFGLAIDNALNFLNNPDGIQGHNFATQVAHVEERRVLQGRLTLVRYNNEPQFFVADASVFLGLVADIMERLGPYLEPDAVEAETLARLRDAIPLIERKTAAHVRPTLSSPRGASECARCATSISPRPGQNRGKTTVSLGVLDGFRRRGLSTGLHEAGRPAHDHRGRRPRRRGRRPHEAGLRAAEPLRQMSPVHIPRGFTQAYIEGEVVEDLPAPDPGRPRGASPTATSLLIEGTGHAGVGAVIGLSNARSRRCSGRPAVIVSEGGVGRPIDEIVLNAALFERHGVRVAGAIVNKVDLDAKPGLARTLERGLARHGIPLLGVLPYRPILSNPTLAMVLEGVHGETHPCRARTSTRSSAAIAIGAMEPEHMLQRIGPRSLVIVPGDRRTSSGRSSAHAPTGPTAAIGALGLVLTGGYRPERGRPRRDPRGRPVRDARPRGHLPGRLGGPRPAGQDPPGRRRQDRRDQGAPVGVPVHRPRPRGGRGGALRLTLGRSERPCGVTSRRRCHRPGGVRIRGRGRSSASGEHARPDQPDSCADPEQPADPERSGDRAAAERAEDRGQPGARREQALGRAAQAGRRPRGDDGHAADEHAARSPAFERRDSTRTTGSADERRQKLAQANASAPATTSRSVPKRAPMRGKAYMNGTSMSAPTAHAIPTSPGLPPRATIWIE